jgi:rubrerythrin
MNESRKQILKEAMAIEMTGREFYRVTAEKTSDDKGRETFEFLSTEEEKHFHLLQTWLLQVEQGEIEPVVLSAPDAHPPSRVFSAEFIRRIGEKHFEMSALSIGALLEKNSLEFYAKAAQDASDPAEKRIFQELSAWETQHHQMLVKELESLQEAYWTTNRFAPF